MIIECPNCGFSGRIPRYAVTVPHLARCLRCRHQFEPIVRFPASLGADVPNGSPAAARGGDPGASSYELKAIAEELGTGVETRGGQDPWAEGSDPWDEHDDVVPAPSKEDAPPVRASVLTHLLRLGTVARREPGLVDPWYARILQAWGIFFLLWAAGIVGANLLYLAKAESIAIAGRETIWSVLSVLLLVPGAAGVFLLVDAGRLVRSLSGQGEERGGAGEPSIDSYASRLRDWATSIRPGFPRAQGRGRPVGENTP